jgi:hypothetical protein
MKTVVEFKTTGAYSNVVRCDRRTLDGRRECLGQVGFGTLSGKTCQVYHTVSKLGDRFLHYSRFRWQENMIFVPRANI